MGINRKSIFSLHRTMWQGRNVWSEHCLPFSRNLTNVPPNCANKARNLRRSVFPCVPHTIWRCSLKLASALEWRIIRGISTVESREVLRTRCLTFSPTIFCWSSMNRMLPCLRLAPCMRVTPAVSARWWNTGSVCLRQWIIVHSNGRNSLNASARRFIFPPHRAIMNLV